MHTMRFDITEWNKSTYEEFRQYLPSLSDEKYKSFHSKIVPVSGSRILGIRVPVLRRIASEIAGGEGQLFVRLALDAEAESYEEITVLGLVIGSLQLSFKEMCEFIRGYAAKVNNWACCDVPVSSFKAIRKYKEEYKTEIDRFLRSENIWEQRVGIVILLDHYLDDEKSAAYALRQTDSVKSREYYVNMAQAWLISVCFVKHRDLTLRYMQNSFSLDEAVAKMTVRKIRDSRRVSEKDKALAGEWF